MVSCLQYSNETVDSRLGRRYLVVSFRHFAAVVHTAADLDHGAAVRKRGKQGLEIRLAELAAVEILRGGKHTLATTRDRDAVSGT